MEWFCLLEVSKQSEFNENYFCCEDCLKAYVNEKVFTRIEREHQQEQTNKWINEEKKQS